MASSIGVMTGADGNLYELFSDGSRVLKEAGYQKRIDAMVATLNSTTNTVGPSPTNTPTVIAAPAVTAAPATVTSMPVVGVSSTSQVKSATKDIIIFPAKNKTQVLGAPKKIMDNKGVMKKMTIPLILQIHNEYAHLLCSLTQ
jgi:hypothetical protein